MLVCPHNVIDYIDGKPKQVAKATAAFDYCGISEGIGCDVCAQVCPRLGEREHHLTERVFGEPTTRYRGAFGVYRRVVAARCTDPEVLARCEDGGVVTGLLAWARRNGRDRRRGRLDRRSRARPARRVPQGGDHRRRDPRQRQLLVHVLPEQPGARAKPRSSA